MIKFRDSNKTYNLKLEMISWRSIIQLSGDELPIEFSDFDVLNEDGVIVDYFEGFNVVYDSGDGYVQLTNDNNTYYNYLVFDENNYVINTNVSTVQRDDAYLYQSGQGKMYKHFSMNLTNEDGFPLYKIEDNKLVETSENERNAYHEEKLKEQVNIAKANKIFECNNICNQMIVKGIEINSENFTYELTDQNNILNNVNLVLQTKLDVPYHADGKPCRLFTPAEIVSIYIAQEHNLTHHITYNNQLKLYIDTLTTVEEVEAVQYSQDLTGDYLATYQLIMAQADALTQAFISGASI